MRRRRGRAQRGWRAGSVTMKKCRLGSEGSCHLAPKRAGPPGGPLGRLQSWGGTCLSRTRCVTQSCHPAGITSRCAHASAPLPPFPPLEEKTQKRRKEEEEKGGGGRVGGGGGGEGEEGEGEEKEEEEEEKREKEERGKDEEEKKKRRRRTSRRSR
eukprot:jgi/Botrbrau1/7500/Bobra.0095s0036.1